MEMQAKRLVLVLVGLFSALVWVGVPSLSGSRALASSSSQSRWEYLVVAVTKDHIWYSQLGTLDKATGSPFAGESTGTETALDAAGKQGWELVGIVGILGGDQEFVFKRPVR